MKPLITVRLEEISSLPLLGSHPELAPFSRKSPGLVRVDTELCQRGARADTTGCGRCGWEFSPPVYREGLFGLT